MWRETVCSKVSSQRKQQGLQRLGLELLTFRSVPNALVTAPPRLAQNAEAFALFLNLIKKDRKQRILKLEICELLATIP